MNSFFRDVHDQTKERSKSGLSGEAPGGRRCRSPVGRHPRPGGYPRTGATELLTRALRDDRFISIRYKAATALGTRGDPLAIEALEDPEFYVREKAAEAMGRIGGTGAVESLLAAYSDRDPDVKRRITRALIDIGPPAEEQVKRAARSPDPNIREAAEEVLREIEARKKRRE